MTDINENTNGYGVILNPIMTSTREMTYGEFLKQDINLPMGGTTMFFKTKEEADRQVEHYLTKEEY